MICMYVEPIHLITKHSRQYHCQNFTAKCKHVNIIMITSHKYLIIVVANYALFIIY